VVVRSVPALSGTELGKQLQIRRVSGVIDADSHETVEIKRLLGVFRMVLPSGILRVRDGESALMAGDDEPLVHLVGVNDEMLSFDLTLATWERILRVADVQEAGSGGYESMRTLRPHRHERFATTDLDALGERDDLHVVEVLVRVQEIEQACRGP